MCVRAFEFSGRRGFQPGRVYELTDGETAELRGLGTKENPEGGMAFFTACGGGEAAKQPRPDRAGIKELREKARSLGLKVSVTDGAERLAEMIANAGKEGAAGSEAGGVS
jgi:hypothetical protein